MGAQQSEAGEWRLEQGTAPFGQRLAALFRIAQTGQSVNGVAHDLNNYLGAIMAYSELVSLDPNLGEESRRMLNDVVESVRKASRLLQALTGIARKDRPRVALLRPAKIIEDLLGLRGYDLKILRIPLEKNVEQIARSLVGDEPRLTVALNCLLTNAMEALEGQQEKLIRVRMQDVGDAIEIQLQDNGPGLTPEMAAAAFEPLVTTKDEAHLGLGLPLARAIAEQHAGTLTYAPGAGFIMRLPWENGLSLV